MQVLWDVEKLLSFLRRFEPHKFGFDRWMLYHVSIVGENSVVRVIILLFSNVTFVTHNA